VFIPATKPTARIKKAYHHANKHQKNPPTNDRAQKQADLTMRSKSPFTKKALARFLDGTISA
jgi:hypothetical protein